MYAPAFIYYRFVILAIGYLDYVNYVKVRLQTPYSCHLYLHYTDHAILKHPQARIIRGLEVPWGVYFCFTGYKTVEQEEAGDSLIHTFTVPDWPICQTFNMITTGTVAGVESPSCGPIFSHHNSGPPPPSYESQLDAPRAWSVMIGTNWGQRLTVENRFVSHLSFKLKREGNPGGTIQFHIRRVSDDALLVNKLWGNANDILTLPDWYEVELDTPFLINEEVYLLAFASQGALMNAIIVYDSIVDVKSNEYMVFRRADGTYINYPTQDFGYSYTYRPGWVMG